MPTCYNVPRRVRLKVYGCVLTLRTVAGVDWDANGRALPVIFSLAP